MFSKLSILIPCYNEEAFIIAVVKKVLDVRLDYSLEKEIIIVDDCSTDNTISLIESFISASSANIVLIRNSENKGKGYCISKAIERCEGDIVIVQDADLEYDPNDYNKLLGPIMQRHADVVYGSRFMGEGPHRVLFFFHTIGNKLLTFLSNLLTQINLTDMETGYKMFRAAILKNITLKEKRFGFEPEVTAKVSRIKGIRIYEVGISYYGRTYEQGKKIKWTDGFAAIWCIIKYNLFYKN